MQAFSDCLWRGFLILYEKQENASVMWHLSSKEDVSSAMREATFTYKTTTILFKRTIISHFQVEDHKYPLKGPAYFQCCQCHADSTRTPNSFYYLFLCMMLQNTKIKILNINTAVYCLQIWTLIHYSTKPILIFSRVRVLTLSEPAFFWVSHGPGGA